MFLINPYFYGGGGGGGGYLVDDYSLDAAFSLRKISTATSNVCLVRRSSDNAELGFTETEIKDGTLTSWTGANNGTVVTLYNQGIGGASYDLTNATASQQPFLVTSGVLELQNGTPALKFDGTQNLNVNAYDGSLLDSYFTVCNVTAVNKRIFTTDNGHSGLRNTAGDNVVTRGDTDITIVGSGSTRGQSLYSSITVNPCATYFDGNTGGTGNQNSFINGQLTLGGGATNYIGYIQELILSTSDETVNRSAIETDINTYYTIY